MNQVETFFKCFLLGTLIFILLAFMRIAFATATYLERHTTTFVPVYRNAENATVKVVNKSAATTVN